MKPDEILLLVPEDWGPLDLSLIQLFGARDHFVKGRNTLSFDYP